MQRFPEKAAGVLKKSGWAFGRKWQREKGSLARLAPTGRDALGEFVKKNEPHERAKREKSYLCPQITH